MSAVAAFAQSLAFEIIRFVLTVIFSLISLLTFPFKPLTRYRIITTWSRWVTALAKMLCGIDYRVTGMENLPAEPSIILSKHQSAWETLAYQVIFPPQVWVLKRSLLFIPFFGWGLAMMSPIAIDRDSGTRALRQTLAQGRARLKAGWWIVMYPEGTRIAPGKRARYHPGGAWLACKTGTKVVPVAHNAGTLWGRNAFVKQAGTITVSIGPAIDPQGLSADQVIAKVEDWIENEVDRLGVARR
jgi:1-acyl-sn-glycerol-3-phosphate acyltransferase